MPEQHKGDIVRALDDIRAAYAAKLPARLQEIADALQLCIDEPGDSARCAVLLHRLHSLAGSAGSFGFAGLGTRATALEALLNAFIKGTAPGGNDFAPVAGGVRQMLKEAQAQLRTGASEAPPPAPAAVPAPTPAQVPAPQQAQPGSRLVYLVQDAEGEAGLAAQLRHFGYEVEMIDDLALLRPRLAARLPAAVIMDLAFPDGVMDGAALLAALREEGRSRFATLFVATRSNFDARLATVRAGADSYFPRPLDIVALVDRLDALLDRDARPGYRILVIDDDHDTAEYYGAVLRQAGMEVRVVHAPAEVLQALVDYRPELVLMDIYMPNCHGAELARLVRQDNRYLDVPIVFLSSEKDLGQQLQAIACGADDFLTKPIAPAHLVSALSSRAARYRELRSLIMRDGLTGLYNHSALKEQLVREVARASRTLAPLALAMLDIDHFKQVNDSYGHAVGDQVIRALSRLLQQRLRRGDVVGRYGGEEFVVIMPDTTAAAGAKVIDAIRESFYRLPQHAEHEDFGVGFSAGVVEAGSGDDAEQLLRRADDAMYCAKRQGRNRVIKA
ncbi:MAG TPA: diguanylate cyclase [Noviherbaspirillum sp.]|jgi:diguanylate cyclase (GGDEF)-like protein|uniref:GGDEF domain-containing response regulator n=1 Tax=Noviherbaspirillum sp. TaxID=1926288 RepID=UPI002F954033